MLITTHHSKNILLLLLTTLLATALMLLAFIATSPATAEVYRIVSEDGAVTYTDNPPADKSSVEAIELPKINTQPALKTDQNKLEANKDTSGQGYQNISIVSPVQEYTVPPGQRTLLVQLALQPALKDGDAVQFMLNGQAYGPASSNLSITLTSLIRGEYHIQARIINSENKIVEQSNITTVYVKRASIAGKSKVSPKAK